MHPILGLRIFEGSHLPIMNQDPYDGPCEYNRWQGIPAVLQYSHLSCPGYVWLCIYF